MNKIGLIGKKLGHSFSKKYFQEKFQLENIKGWQYDLYELPSANEFLGLLEEQPMLKGVNVTIPYKQDVIPLLDKIDDKAARIGAVNVIKVLEDNTKVGYNSDYFGFKNSLESWINGFKGIKALVLGTGGASKAVKVALEDLKIPFISVSRNKSENTITYADLIENPEIVAENQLIINTTPLGMYPEVDRSPDLPYSVLTEKHYLYDLVYNPEVTLFMNKGLEKGAKVKNGLEMLELQADKSWEIWNT